MRGVFLAGSLSADRGWRDLAVASVLPGLRAAGTGNPPDAELLATAGGVWVVRRS
jgi:hypothetical protein